MSAYTFSSNVNSNYTLTSAGNIIVTNTTSTTSPSTGALIVSGGITGTDLIISNRINSLGYQLNSTIIGNPIYTSLKSVNKRIKTSRATAVKSVTNWYSRTVTNNNLFRISWSPELSLFAAVPFIGTSLNTSPDGINWTTRTLPTSGYGYDITWSPENGKFVMVNYTGSSSTTNNIVSSTDGITWSSKTTPSSVGFYGICWAVELGLFVACSDTAPYILTSADGNTWTGVTGPGQGYAICWSSELKLLIVLGNNAIYRSADSINWNTNSGSVVVSQTVASYVCWADELYTFVVANGSTNILTSSDGINWNTSSTLNSYLGSCVWSPDLSMILVGNNSGNIYYSSDAVQWTQVNISGSASLGMCWSKELSIFAITNISSSTLYTSTPALPTNLNTIKGPSSQIYLDPSTGRLGINQSSPSYLLDVNGTMRVTGITNLTSNTTSSSTSTGTLVITGGLGISGNIYSGGTLNNTGAVNLATSSGTTTIGSSSSNPLTISTAGLLTIANSTNGTSYSSGQSVLISGGVGVAGNIYSNGILYVSGSVSTAISSPGYKADGTSSSLVNYSGTPQSLSIYASSSIYTGGIVFVASDIRIKNIEKNDLISLDNIDNIEPTIYTMKDKIKYGNKKRLGFIAQNVYKYEPDAISKLKEVIPDIFKIAKIINNNTIELINHELKINERIKIILDDKEEIVNIINIINENKFMIDKELNIKNEIFIYGREIDDFHHIDYNYLSSLAFAGVKQLRKENKETLKKLKNILNYLKI